MPDQRKHRGPHPEDEALFGVQNHSILREAAAHLSWLLSNDYAPVSSLKLVGDRFRLTERQRTAVIRSACNDAALQSRLARQVDLNRLEGESVSIDGFNLLTTIEAALAGGVILCGRDGCYRDMASMHGSYRKVEETHPALVLIGETLAQLGIKSSHWYLDRPVSNAGRLSIILREVAEAAGWDWSADLVADPDRCLAEHADIVVTADSWILDRSLRWLNLAAHIVSQSIPTANIVTFSDR